MPAGRKPKPTELKVLQGNPGKRPIRRAAAAGRQRQKAPAAPAWLPATGQAEWRRMARTLMQMRVLTDTDLTALAAYCDSYARWLEARQVLEDEGLVVETGTGSVKGHPAAQIVHQALTQMRAFMVEFGLTPSSRSRVAPPAQQEPSEFELFLARKNRQAEEQERAA